MTCYPRISKFCGFFGTLLVWVNYECGGAGGDLLRALRLTLALTDVTNIRYTV